MPPPSTPRWVPGWPAGCGPLTRGGITAEADGAVDGKAVRGTRHASSDGQPVHLLAVIDQQAGAVLRQAAVDGKTNEITQFAPLLAGLNLAQCVITADALPTQRNHAGYLVTDRKADYILVVKGSQPGLHAQLRKLPWKTIPAAANAQLKSWRILRELRCCPWRAGQLVKAIHVLQTREVGG